MTVEILESVFNLLVCFVVLFFAYVTLVRVGLQSLLTGIVSALLMGAWWYFVGAKLMAYGYGEVSDIVYFDSKKGINFFGLHPTPTVWSLLAGMNMLFGFGGGVQASYAPEEGRVEHLKMGIMFLLFVAVLFAIFGVMLSASDGPGPTAAWGLLPLYVVFLTIFLAFAIPEFLYAVFRIPPVQTKESLA